jgi:hypothetical protein
MDWLLTEPTQVMHPDDTFQLGELLIGKIRLKMAVEYRQEFDVFFLPES